METRTVGLTEAIEFHDATAEVGSEMPYQLRAIEIMLAASVEKLVPDAPEGYAEALAAGADVVAQDFRGALERFERAAADFPASAPDGMNHCRISFKGSQRCA